MEPNVEIVQAAENDLQTVQVIQEEMVFTIQDDGSFQPGLQDQMMVQHQGEEGELITGDSSAKRVTQKQFLAGNAYVKCQKSGPLNE